MTNLFDEREFEKHVFNEGIGMDYIQLCDAKILLNKEIKRNVKEVLERIQSENMYEPIDLGDDCLNRLLETIHQEEKRYGLTEER